MIAGKRFEPLAGRPPDCRAGFSHATTRLRLGNRSSSVTIRDTALAQATMSRSCYGAQVSWYRHGSVLGELITSAMLLTQMWLAKWSAGKRSGPRDIRPWQGGTASSGAALPARTIWR